VRGPEYYLWVKPRIYYTPDTVMFRAIKKPSSDTRTTLDNLHNQKMSQLINRDTQIEQIRNEIRKLEKEADEMKDIVIKTKKEDELEKKKAELKRWQSDDPLFSYLFDTGEIVFKYYELQEKIQNGENTEERRVVKAKPGSVLAALETAAAQEGQVASIQVTSDPSVQKHEGRDVLLEKYLQRVDPESAKGGASTLEDPNGICDVCGKEMIFSANEALFTCSSCGNQEFVLIDSDKPSYKDPPREVTYYAYKRINHFNEWLAQFQAKESTDIPEEIFQSIIDELKKERITNTSTIKPTKIKEILKKLKCSNYYDHVPYILNRINGKNAATMSREIEEKLRYMFKEIQPSFQRHCPAGRSNFLSYSYVLYKFCELLELDEYLVCFPLLKNRDKLYNQDKIWKLICADMKWEFYKSI
jgi:Poxvirus Late Transcription Factor VLTF3 like